MPTIRDYKLKSRDYDSDKISPDCQVNDFYQSEVNRVWLDGRQEQGCKSVLRQLGRQVGNVSIDLQECIKALPIEQSGILVNQEIH
jgi:Domain of unknown function (DUF4351)